ncbi:MAG: hypothetical protein ACKOGA_01745 [Planctomycetaceae bacterium]
MSLGARLPADLRRIDTNRGKTRRATGWPFTGVGRQGGVLLRAAGDFPARVT